MPMFHPVHQCLNPTVGIAGCSFQQFPCPSSQVPGIICKKHLPLLVPCRKSFFYNNQRFRPPVSSGSFNPWSIINFPPIAANADKSALLPPASASLVTLARNNDSNSGSVILSNDCFGFSVTHLQTSLTKERFYAF